MDRGINFALAAWAGGKAVRPGPEITPQEGIRLVADLKNQTAKAFGYVAEITGLTEPAAAAAQRAQIAVVDRRGFVSGLVQMVQSLVAGAWETEDLTWVAGQTAGAQLGAVGAVLGGRVLGLYDPFHGAGNVHLGGGKGADAVPPLPAHQAVFGVNHGRSAGSSLRDHLGSETLTIEPNSSSSDSPQKIRLEGKDFVGSVLGASSSDSVGRILLVAPNILRFERELDADPRDFHLWVALHEVTHAVQFAAAPWLAGWIRQRFQAILDADAEEGRVARLMNAARRLPQLFADDPPPGAFAVGLLTPPQAEVLTQVTAAMSLLEGHADVIMDGTGPNLVRSVEELRPRFDARRLARGRLERAARRLAGLEAKTAQYVQGAQFVRAVLAQVGHEGLNQAFTEPTSLPTAAEMEDPAAWIARVLQ
jgi:uncharacterized protein (DUF2342 family)